MTPGSGKLVMPLVNWKKPMILANQILDGSEPWMMLTSKLMAERHPVVCMSSGRDEDLLGVARCFASATQMTAEQFALEGWRAYRKTFGRGNLEKAIEDPIAVPSVTRILDELAARRFLVIDGDGIDAESEFLGSQVINIGFDELDAICTGIDEGLANERAERWMQSAEQIVDARTHAVRNAARVFLGLQKLMENYRSDTVTINCRRGFALGKLHGYPCLGFAELLDGGSNGVCEGRLADVWGVALCRIMTGRPGFVSSLSLDTSGDHAIYSQCMAPRKVLGANSQANSFRLRTLHNRDPFGACMQSNMPAGYVTTSFRIERGNVIFHQAQSAGNYESERGCRNQLVGRIRGDLEKLMGGAQATSRITVFGDVKEPLKELAAALKLGFIEEA